MFEIDIEMIIDPNLDFSDDGTITPTDVLPVPPIESNAPSPDVSDTEGQTIGQMTWVQLIPYPTFWGLDPRVDRRTLLDLLPPISERSHDIALRVCLGVVIGLSDLSGLRRNQIDHHRTHHRPSSSSWDPYTPSGHHNGGHAGREDHANHDSPTGSSHRSNNMDEERPWMYPAITRGVSCSIRIIIARLGCG